MTANYLATQFAQYVAPDHPLAQLLIVRLVDALSQGHSCLSLTDQDIALVSQIQHPALVLEGRLLYLARYASYEIQLAQGLCQLAQATQNFPIPSQHFTDPYQQQAAQLALNKQLAIITGGPGTGKTTTVVNILALLLQQHPSLTIALAAPTGKAATRLSASIVNSLHHSKMLSTFSPEIIANIPQQASTLHRLLGAKPLSLEFRHDHHNPLLEDVIVVDEASMIDLALMSKLVQALKPNAKLILLGDKDQLASVESGAVLADCYQALQKNRVELQTTYRFEGDIKSLAVAVNQQNADTVIQLLGRTEPCTSVCWQDREQALASLHQAYLPYFAQVEKSSTQQDIYACFEQFDAFQLLSPVRQGEVGVARLNYLVEKSFGVQGQQWYAGRPVMIIHNDRNTHLYNGDIGLCLPSPEHDGKLRVFFRQNGELMTFVPSRLPEHETAFAMTIHKSQGSEFAHVMILLPELSISGHDPALLTKELLYTAITRSKKRVTLVGEEKTIRRLIAAKVSRSSGLASRLLGCGQPQQTRCQKELP